MFMHLLLSKQAFVVCEQVRLTTRKHVSRAICSRTAALRDSTANEREVGYFTFCLKTINDGKTDFEMVEDLQRSVGKAGFHRWNRYIYVQHVGKADEYRNEKETDTGDGQYVPIEKWNRACQRTRRFVLSRGKEKSNHTSKDRSDLPGYGFRKRVKDAKNSKTIIIIIIIVMLRLFENLNETFFFF